MSKMTEYEKQFFPIHSTERKSNSLYAVFNALPYLFNFTNRNSIIKGFAKMTSDPKVTLASDQLYMPRIVPGGVSVYDSLSNGGLIRTMRSL